MLLLLQSHNQMTDKNNALEKQLDYAKIKIRCLELTVQEQEAQIEASETKIEELERFSTGVAALHKALASETDLGQKFELLESGDYTKDEDVQEWNDFTNRFLEIENDTVPFIKSLKDSIAVYRNTILPRSYRSRFLSLFSHVPPNVGFDTHLGTFYKLHIPYQIKWIKFNKTQSASAFKQKAWKDTCGFRTSDFVTSYVENDCLQFYFQYHDVAYQIFLLSHCDDKKYLKLKVDGKTQITDEYVEHSFAFFIVK